MDENKELDASFPLEENFSMEQLIEKPTLSFIKQGDIIKAKFVQKTSEGYLFDIGQKQEAIAPLSENIPEDLLSSEIRVKVIKPYSSELGGHTLVSYRDVIREEASATLKEAFKNKTPVTGVVVKSVKGGYIIDLGIEAFLPKSQLTLRKEISAGDKITCFIIEYKGKNVVVSEKLYTESIRNQMAEETLSKISVGNIVEGTVTHITKFGAFIDIGGIDALLHIKDISWGGQQQPEKLFKVGQKLKTKIITIDPTTRKISVGLKQLTENPWNNVEKKYSVGSNVRCKVRNITDFGVFCELEEGVEGLLHISEVDWYNPKPDLKKVFSKDGDIELKIVEIDVPKNRISLSLKRLKPDPWEEAAKKISAGSKVEATVVDILPFGALMEVERGVVGTLNLKNIDWMKIYKNPKSIFKLKQKMTVYVLEFDPQRRILELSLKHLSESPFEKYRVKTVVEGVVKKILPHGVLISLDEQTEATIPKKEISRKKSDTIDNLLKVGDKVTGMVILSDPDLKRIEVSIKKYEISQEQKLLAMYSSEKPGPHLKELLEEV